MRRRTLTGVSTPDAVERRDRRRARGARRPVRARRRDRAPRAGVPHGRAQRARRARCRSRRWRAKAAPPSCRESARRCRRRSWRCSRPGRSRRPRSCARSSRPAWSRSRACPGLGPKRARLLHSELGIDSPEALREAALAQRLRTCAASGRSSRKACSTALAEGAGEQTQAASCCCRARSRSARALAAGLRELGGSDNARAARRLGAAAGRQRQGHRPDRRHDAPDGARQSLASSSRSRASARRQGGRASAHALGRERRPAHRQAAQLGNLLQHFTGSGRHNAALREAAVRRGLHVSEYGVLDDATGRTRTCATEARAVRAARAGLHRAGAAREPRRARGGALDGGAGCRS